MESLLDGAKERVGAVAIDELKAMASELMPEMLGIFKGQVRAMCTVFFRAICMCRSEVSDMMSTARRARRGPV